MNTAKSKLPKAIHLVGTLNKFKDSYSYNVAKHFIKKEKWQTSEVHLVKHPFLANPLTPEVLSQGISKQSQYYKTFQLLYKYDVFILSFGMINYTVPYCVKNLLDNWLANNLAFLRTGHNQYQGLYKNKKALVVIARGDNILPNNCYDKFTTLTCLNLIGIDKVKIVEINNTTAEKNGRIKYPVKDIIRKELWNES